MAYRIKDFPSTAATPAADDFVPLDGTTNGPRKFALKAALDSLALPSQTGNSGKYLTTDGSTASWGTVSSGGTWGSITGTLSSQTDLQSALNAKASLSGAAFTGALSTSDTLTAGNGAPAAVGFLILNGGTNANTGAVIRLNRGGTIKWQIGTESGITGGTSDAWMLYDQSGGAIGLKYTTGTGLAVTGTLSATGAISQNGNQVLHAGNYTSYSPSLTGTGASGTWGISISGNAANVTGTVALANGGTGATDAGTARTNLGLGSVATQAASNVALTGGSAANLKVLELIEDGTASATATTGSLNYDVKTQTLLYYTSNASGNWTLNIRGDGSTTLDSLMATGDSMTIAFLVTQGATPYYCTAITIDGNANTPKWQGGTAPTAGNASGIDSYTYTVIKTASATFTVLAAQTQFK